MSKLLDKPFRAFSWYALFILAASIPVYFLVVDFIWLNELDEHNRIIKERIEEKLQHNKLNNNDIDSVLNFWNLLQTGPLLRPVSGFRAKKDSVYELMRANTQFGKTEIDRFRGLSSLIILNDRPYLLTIETNVEEAGETLAALAVISLFFFLLLVGGFIFLNRKIAEQVWLPFRKTLEKLGRFDLHSGQKINFENSDIEEFNMLHSTLAKLIDKNISDYENQKKFIENASHELQTPLAVLKTKIDLLFQEENLSRKQVELMNAALSAAGRASGITKNLLFLAKIGNNQFADNQELEIKFLTEETLELISFFAEDKGIRIEQKAFEPAKIICNKILLEAVLTNLLSNAIRHSPKNGRIRLAFENRKWQISNSGTAALDEKMLFRRFAASSSPSAGSGLGLSIVKEIGKRYGWEISYYFEAGFHVFSVQF